MTLFDATTSVNRGKASLQDAEMEMKSQLMCHVAIHELYFNLSSGKVAHSEIPGGDGQTFAAFFFFFFTAVLNYAASQFCSAASCG